jgi:hypothetical protein
LEEEQVSRGERQEREGRTKKRGEEIGQGREER